MKSTTKKTQLQTIFHFLHNHVATNAMVSEATGISRPSICRFKRDLELKGRLFEVVKKPCEITHKRAWYLTCNPSLVTIESAGYGE